MSKTDWQRGYDVGKNRGYNYGRNDWKTALVSAIVGGVVNIAIYAIQNRINATQDSHNHQNNQSRT